MNNKELKEKLKNCVMDLNKKNILLQLLEMQEKGSKDIIIHEIHTTKKLQKDVNFYIISNNQLVNVTNLIYEVYFLENIFLNKNGGLRIYKPEHVINSINCYVKAFLKDDTIEFFENIIILGGAK